VFGGRYGRIWKIVSWTSILYIHNFFVVLKNCTVCLTRRYFSYRGCTCEISCAFFVLFVVIARKREVGRSSFVQNGPKQFHRDRNVYRWYKFLCKFIVGLVNSFTIKVDPILEMVLFFSTTIFTLAFLPRWTRTWEFKATLLYTNSENALFGPFYLKCPGSGGGNIDPTCVQRTM